MRVLDYISDLRYIAKGEHGFWGVLQYAYSLVHKETKARSGKQQNMPENSRNLENLVYTH